ncbi:MAG TPA: HD domain-containing protein [Phycisphaerae bacterium]|nr:HD domain-containing protein [Phycisphaerae bacterium]
MADWKPLPASSDALDTALLIGPVPRIITPVIRPPRRLPPRRRAQTTVQAWLLVIDVRDPALGAHLRRVGRLARDLGIAAGLTGADLDALEWSGRLHDVGKLGIPDGILNKPGRLTAAEFERVKLHPRLGYELVRHQSALDATLPGILHHHENYDGSGYPGGLRGEETPLPARILRIVDSFDAMTWPRVYGELFTADAALRELRRGAGAATDPHLTELFCTLKQSAPLGQAGALGGAAGPPGRV